MPEPEPPQLAFVSDGTQTETGDPVKAFFTGTVA
jgi:hypothetical protein